MKKIEKEVGKLSPQQQNAQGPGENRYASVQKTNLYLEEGATATESTYGRPLHDNDIEGDTIVDVKGNVVEVTRNPDGSLSYKFDASYSEQKLEKVKAHFMERTAPVLEEMNTSELGKADVDFLISARTEFAIKSKNNANPGASSHTKGKNIGEDGLYESVSITPYVDFLNAQSKQQKNTTGEELLFATMHVEVLHNTLEGIALDEKTGGWELDPEMYKERYQFYLNEHVRARIEYRKTNHIEIDKDVYSIIFTELSKWAGITLDEENQKSYDALEKQP